MTAEEIVALKKKCDRLCKYPMEYLSVPEFCALVGQTDPTMFTQVIALYHDVDAAFVKGFLKVLDAKSGYIDMGGIDSLKEIKRVREHQIGKHFIEYSDQWEAKEKAKVGKMETNASLAKFLSTYCSTIDWQFDQSVETVNRVIDLLIEDIQTASVTDLTSCLSPNDIEPVIKARVAHEFVARKVEPTNNRAYGILHGYFEKGLAIPPIEYIWDRMRSGTDRQFVSALLDLTKRGSGSHGELVSAMINAITARDFPSGLDKERNFEKLEMLYRKAASIYSLKKAVLLRIIEVARSTPS